MLTVDHVQTRRSGDLLKVVPLSETNRIRGMELAEIYVGIVSAHVGCERRTLSEAIKQIPVAATEKRLADGLWKLICDRCEFEESSSLDSVSVRAALFARATAARKSALAGDFQRERVMIELAAELGVTPSALEAAIYGDLPDAHILRAANVPAATRLIEDYDVAQMQAVLLRAVRLSVRVEGTNPWACRLLFRKLKFFRLLHQIRKSDDGGGYDIEIDGPFSLFENVTKYGLNLALAFPAIIAAPMWRLEADLRWGKTRTPLKFRLSHKDMAHAADEAAARAMASPPDDVSALMRQLKTVGGEWRVKISDALLDLPGVGTCVPDLELKHKASGRVVYVEVLGYWNRDAVWRRVEMAEGGLTAPIIFAVSKHLRVSEAVLDDDASSALYVYSRVINAAALLKRADVLLSRESTKDSRARATETRRKRLTKP